jgi:hypothetical protein
MLYLILGVLAISLIACVTLIIINWPSSASNSHGNDD